jgi:hypothetical protein
MTIFAAQAATSTCPPGCGGHLNGPTHISVDQVVTATAYAGEHRKVYVSRELDERLGAPAVRLSGASDAPMTPAEAMQLACALAIEAFAAMTTWTVAR